MPRSDLKRTAVLAASENVRTRDKIQKVIEPVGTTGLPPIKHAPVLETLTKGSPGCARIDTAQQPSGVTVVNVRNDWASLLAACTDDD